MTIRTIIASLAAILLLLATPTAQAAVRLCDAEVEGHGQEATTEAEARKAALADWQARAGATFTWSLAGNKGITCLKSAKGGFVCKATGHPCALYQKPPEGPLRRLMPAAPGNGT